MNLAHRLNYYRRIFPAYLGRSNSHLTFGHDSPDINYRFAPRSLGTGLAFEARQKETSEGGMVHVDERGDPWLEEKWDGYRRNFVKRNAALAYKSAFKLLYY